MRGATWWAGLSAVVAAAVPGLCGTPASAAPPGAAPAAVSGYAAGRSPWAAPAATVVVDPALAGRARTATKVFRYIDAQIGARTRVRVRPVGSYLTDGAAADLVQTVRLGDPGAGHLAFTWRYTTPEGAVHSDTVVRPGLPASGPGSFTRVLAHEAEMSVGVGECSDPGAVCFWTFGTSRPWLDGTDRARLDEVRAYVEAQRAGAAVSARGPGAPG